MSTIVPNHQGAVLYGDWLAVVPSDSAVLSTKAPCNGLYVGSSGDVKIQSVNGNAVVFSAVPGGTFMPVRAVQVYATGTTASEIVAVY